MSTSFNIQIISPSKQTLDVYGRSEGGPDTVLGVLVKWFPLCQSTLDLNKLLPLFADLHRDPSSHQHDVQITDLHQGEFEYIIDYRPAKPTLTVKCHDEHALWVKNNDRIIHPVSYVVNSFRRACQIEGVTLMMSHLSNLEQHCGIVLAPMQD